MAWCDWQPYIQTELEGDDPNNDTDMMIWMTPAMSNAAGMIWPKLCHGVNNYLNFKHCFSDYTQTMTSCGLHFLFITPSEWIDSNNDTIRLSFLQSDIHSNSPFGPVGCLKPLSQLAHDHFTTLCDRNILASHDLSHTLHDHSHSLHLF